MILLNELKLFTKTHAIAKLVGTIFAKTHAIAKLVRTIFAKTHAIAHDCLA